MKIKKLSVFLVLAIFMISLVPAVVLAKDSEPVRLTFVKKSEVIKPTNVKEVKEDVGKNVNAFATKVKAGVNAKVNQEGNLTEKATQVIAKVQANLGKAKVNMEKARERYETAKQKYQTAKKRYLASKEKVLKLKKQASKCKDDNCTDKKQFRNQTRDHLIDLADVILGTLEKLEEKVNSSDMNETEKADLLADIASQIEAIEDAKEVLEDLTGEVTAEDLQNAIKTIKDAWEDTKPEIEYGAGKLVNAKLGNLVVSIGQLEQKFEKIRNQLEVKGYDVSSLDDYLEEMDEKMDSIGNDWDKAREEFQEAKQSKDKKGMNLKIKEAHRYQTKARKTIKEVREDIRDIVNEIRKLQKQDVDGGDDNETEDEEEEEEVDDFESCVAAGNPVMESYPRQCSHDDQTFTEELDDEDNETSDGNQTI